MKSFLQLLQALAILAAGLTVLALSAVGGLWLALVPGRYLPTGVLQGSVGLLLLLSWIFWGRKVDEYSAPFRTFSKGLIWIMAGVALFFTAVPFALGVVFGEIHAPGLGEILLVVAGVLGTLATFWIASIYAARGFFTASGVIARRWPDASTVVGGLLYVGVGIGILLLAGKCGFRGFGP